MIMHALSAVLGATFGYSIALWVVRPDLQSHCESCSCDYDYDQYEYAQQN
jgi:hypothetical protein